MAARTVFRAMSRFSYSNPRLAVVPCNYLRQTFNSVPSSIFGTRIIHSDTFPHRCSTSCAEKCAAGSVKPPNFSSEVANISLSCFFSTVKTTDSKPDQEDHAASKSQQVYDLAEKPEEVDDSAEKPEEDDDSASESEKEEKTVLNKKQDAGKGVLGAEINVSDATRRVYRRPLSPEEVKEADGIGYRVIGSAKRLDGKPWRQDPIFAVIQVGSHQFKVCRGDWIYVEKLKYADVKQKIILNKVLMLGTKSETVIGRPIVPDAAVHALVEEHQLGAETIIFKKKRRKNYRRTNYHRQELTRLKIIGVEGLKEPVVAKAVTA